MPEISERSFEEAIEREICGQKFVDTRNLWTRTEIAGRVRLEQAWTCRAAQLVRVQVFFPKRDPKKRSKDILDAIAKIERYAA